MTKDFLRLAALVVFAGLLQSQNLFVAGQNSSNVVQYDGVTGAPLGVFANGSVLSTAYGVTFGPDGHLYVSSYSSGQILKYDGDTGAFLGIFAIPQFPRDLTFGPDGHLYVVSSFLKQVLKYDGATGAFLGVFTAGVHLDVPYSLSFGADGNLYVTDAGGDEVLKYHGTTGAFLGVFASAGLDSPFGLTFGPDGNLYVANFQSNQVTKHDSASGALLGVFASAGLDGAFGLTFGPDGNLYVASFWTNQVLKYHGVTGTFLGVFASGGGIDGPTYLAFKPGPRGAADSPFQVRYVANLNVVDSLINITNTGANGAMPFGPGIGPEAGNLCVNVYAFSPDEQMVGCCSCHVTPNGLASLSVYNDIRAITLTGLTPNSMVIKLVATGTGPGPSFGGGASACSQSAAGLNVTHPVASRGGLSAWGTTGHVPGAFPAPGAPAPFGITETKFTPATLSEAEITSLNNRCTAILGNGSTFGTCRSCTVGGRGSGRL